MHTDKKLMFLLWINTDNIDSAIRIFAISNLVGFLTLTRQDRQLHQPPRHLSLERGSFVLPQINTDKKQIALWWMNTDETVHSTFLF
jgi:6-phosphogluconolactonase (cycloisomerase 2 family)